MGEGRLVFFDSFNDYQSLFSRIPQNQRDVYYTAEYYRAHQNKGDGRAACFIYEEGANVALYPFLMNSISGLGYLLPEEYYDIQGAYGYNGIIVSSREPSFIASFHKAFDEFCIRQNIVAEFTRFHPILNNQELASPLMKTYNSRQTVKLDLTKPLDDIWRDSFSSKNRNVIKKAVKDGVVILESHDYELFRRMYDETMKNVQAEDFYFFPKQYYSDFQRLLGDRLLLCFAMYEGNPISGSMFMFYGDYAHYHLSGRDRTYYKIAASNVILWYAIQKAKERGCKWFHFGGGTTEDSMDPLLHFKRNFSRETSDFWFGKRVHNPEIYDRIITQWRDCHPDSYQKNTVKLLGYREI